MYLEIKDLTVLYDRAMVLNGVSLTVGKGEFVSLVGPNGAGKTTLLRAIAGLVKWEKDTLKGTRAGRITLEGSVKFDGEEVTNLPAHEIVRRGLILCPERGRPFREMTVLDNLRAGAFGCKDKKVVKENLERVYHLFPRLKERENQISGTLSGGERFMLTIGRAMMSQPKLFMIDEPSVGLAPKVKEDLFARVKEIYEQGSTILMTEQDVSFAFDLAGRNYVISKGHLVGEGTAEDLLADESLRKTYLGL
ncbi:ABC transporter ATP-binding protein [Dehalococcoidia bacterium]|nr:ABC transporter ATP-binding protein [Dehalococcoidia bacterium]MCL0074168.1 ABC transporter ATP-binding protein [Dehalococcoidia bacterium]